MIHNGTMTNPPSIFEFEDIQLYLQEVFRWKQRSNPRLTMRSWAGVLGLKSSSLLMMCLSGHRFPNPELRRALEKNLELSRPARTYLGWLIELGHSRGDQEKYLRLQADIRAERRKRAAKKIDQEIFDVISNWYFYALREMSLTSDFSANPERLAKQFFFELSPAQIDSALTTLQKVGLLIREKNVLRPSTSHVMAQSGSSEGGLKQFHHQILSLGQESLEDINESMRHLIGSTFVVQSQRLPAMKERLEKLLFEFIQEFEDQQGDLVLHTEKLLIPLVKVRRKKNRK